MTADDPEGGALGPPPETLPTHGGPRASRKRRAVTEDGAAPAASRPARRRRDTLRGVPTTRRIRDRVAGFVRGVEDRAAESKQRRLIYPLLVLRVITQVLRQWARDKCPQQAASLAFQTVLSVVPLLAVSLALLRATGSLSEQSAFVKFLASELIPVSEDAISAQLLAWSENVSFKSLGTVGLITTVVLAFLMANSLEKVASYIWRAEKKRSLSQKFMVFYATVTVGPALLAVGVYEAAQVGLTEGATGVGMSFLFTFIAMFLGNYYLPACPVRVKPAVWGAAAATLLFELSKFAFKAYSTEFALERYEGIYGAVAIAPLWLLWVYYTWLTMLLGFEVAHAAQNLHLLERVDRRGTMSLENEIIHRVNGVTAARVMVAIARAYARGDKVMSRRRLEEEFDLSDEVLNRITGRLKRHDLVIEVEGDLAGFLPARPPSEISLAQVMRAFRGQDVEIQVPGAGAQKSPLDKVLTDLEADAMQRTARLTLDQLV